MRDQYDYIVVGAGSAGCALAGQLAEDPDKQILLIESGPADNSPFINMPRGLGIILNPGSKYIWEYQVQTGGNGPEERWARGRTLGGSSSVNGMVYMRGAPMDYDNWAALGCKGWSWNEVGATYARLESHDQGPSEWRGDHGPLHITTHPSGDPLFSAILKAGEEMGIPQVADVNSSIAVKDGGLGWQPTTRFKGKRFSAARAFLADASQRPNLDIVTETDVLRVEFEGQRAIGVRVRDKSGERSINAVKETILSCGALQTPKLLQLSGIGDANLLKSLGIGVIVDAPEVGRNLREHRHVDLKMKVKSRSQNPDLSGWRAIVSALRYFLFKSGPMSHAAHEIGGFAKSTPDLDHADLQFGLMSMSTGRKKDGEITIDPYHAVTFVTYFTRPESQGEVRITSSDPAAAPYVNANHLSTEIDRKKFVAAFRWNRRLAQQPALKAWGAEELEPTASLNTDDEILAHAMELGGTCFHMAGTARMGVDEGAVCDPQLRVKGVNGLRVADTSIMPTLVSGNTNGPAMIIGMRCADFIMAQNG